MLYERTHHISILVALVKSIEKKSYVAKTSVVT